ncbi:DNA cytosine methyltransferase [Isoptericola sp. NPDC056134]|uniref:DNA cytosine methyltransferase n=1 Tax=Isoptericola sp. NPDC056134 TaxID=3345723 RepID=UPI0035E695F5
MKNGALFAGYGGLDRAVESVFGARTVWVSDVDPGPCKILAHRFPDVPNLGDITRISWADVEPVDILSGGSPCQDVSHAGKRAGMKAGTRSGLWASMCDAVEIIRPRFVVWENVRGALSAEAAAGDVESCVFCVDDDGEPPLRALGRVLGDLAELGYDAAWVGLRAADVGAPHGRYRVFVLAWDASRPAGLGGAAPAAVPADLGHERSGEARDGRSGPADGRGGAGVNLLPTPTATDHKASGASYDPTDTHHAGTTLTDATVRNAAVNPDLMPTPSDADVEGGRKHRSGARSGELLLNGLAHHQAFGQYGDAIARWETVLGRVAPAPTEPTGREGAHRLSPRFVEWMMGLPDGWVTDTDTTRNEQLKALGNGVVPQQAEAALRHLLTVREAALRSEVAA